MQIATFTGPASATTRKRAPAATAVKVTTVNFGERVRTSGPASGGMVPYLGIISNPPSLSAHWTA
jgi:hypothetical protein